jgi:coenzyme F420-reducing hydrogenase delta subunit
MHAYTGLYSFDNVFISLLTIYQAMTLAGWSEVMYNVQVRVVNVVSVVQCSAVK